MTTQISYTTLLRQNSGFRRLWLGQIVSELGDWLDSIALYALLLRLTGSGQAIGLLLVAQMLPSALIGPWAGVLVDRLPRKWVMVVVDLARIPLVLLLLVVHTADQIWLIYLVTVLKNSLTAFFEPARGAILPSLARRDELVVANNISSVTWSTMLAVGTALGGLVVGLVGPETAFVLDAASFAVSALILASIRVDESRAVGRAITSGWDDLRQGVRYLAQNRDVATYTFIKTFWGLAQGSALAFTLLAHSVFPIGVEGAISIGLIFAARGVGAGIGPILAERLGGSSVGFLRRAIGPAFLVGALGFFAAGVAPTLGLVLLAACLGAMGGSTQWVFSTSLIQLSAPPRLLGRIFSVEQAGFTLAAALSNYSLGILSDLGYGPSVLLLGLGLLATLSGLGLMVVLHPTPNLALTEVGDD